MTHTTGPARTSIPMGRMLIGLAAAAAALLAATTTARAQAQDCQWSPLGEGLTEGFGPIPKAMLAFDDGEGPALFVAGGFQRAGGVISPGIGRWDGSAWSGLGEGLYFAGPSALTSYDDGTGPALYAAGEFFEAGGMDAEKIARWTPAGGWQPVGGGLDAGGGSALSLAVFDDGSGEALYVGGRIDAAGGVPVRNIARWDGSAWSDVGGGVDGAIWAMAVYDDGAGPALYAAGRFNAAGGQPARNIARWDGERWTALGPGLFALDGRPTVAALAVYDDGAGPALYAGGAFDGPGGGSAEFFNNIAKWDGLQWSALSGGVPGSAPGQRPVQALTVHDPGDGERLYVGGWFTAIDGAPAGNLASWDGERWDALAGGLEQAVTALGVYDDGSGPALFAGGWFERVDGQQANHIAKLDGCVPVCRADLLPNGELNLFDFLVFQNLFAAGDLAADFDGDGRLTIFDFLVFQNEFAVGCG